MDEAKAIILMSVYQMRYLDRIPDFAIINEAVAIAKKEGKSAAEIVNILNKKSGYIGFYPASSDARDLRKAQAEGNELAD